MTEIDLTPITRLEYDIDAILNDHAVAEPITRIELILADIVAGNTTTVVPVTRIETYLAIISGADYPVPEPVTRIETFLAIIAGEDYETPEAVTRLEGLLAEWVEKGSGIWKTVTGSLIHLTDALASPMQKCEVSLEPKQDLHGQDAPYPAGGGVNILDPNLKFTAGTYYGGVVLSTTDGYNFTLSGTPTGSGDIKTNTVALEDAVILPAGTYITTAATASIYSATGSWIRNQYSKTPFTIDQPFFIRNFYLEIVSGRTHNVTGFITLAKGSTAPTEWSPYSNICPITGWTGCEVTRTGKNLVENVLQGCAINGVGQIFFSSGFNVVVAKVKKGVTYTLNDNVSPSNNSVYAFYTEAPIVGSLPYNGNRVVTTNYTFTSPIDGYVGFRVPDDFQYPQVEIGTERTDYEPYQGTTLSVTFPDSAGTVYGGTYDFVSGGLKPYKEYDSYNGETLTGRWMSSMDKYVAGTTPTIGAQVVDLDSYDTTVQLTPQPISTLAGENNVWSNSNGDTTIIYKAQSS